MCGVAGFVCFSPTFPLAGAIRSMTLPLAHRGPDDAGCWVDENTGVALGHRRLSILDLSPQGHQPMASANARFMIVFNGEIYNYQELREDLLKAGYPGTWRGHSDTEVILAAVSHWGLEVAVKKMTGMFSMALWDREQQVLSLVRDRLGEKPMYYGWVGHTFSFASELKALQAHPEWTGEINRDALALLLRFNYIPAPHSIYRHIYKLLPGTILSISTANARNREMPAPVPYWSADAAIRAGKDHVFAGTATDAIDRLDTLLRDSIRHQMVADVPLGAFLSGGIDSSTVVALMQAQSPRPVKTFTIGFDDPRYNEARHAKAVAEFLKTDHHELYLQPDQAIEVIPDLPTIYDEPFSDSSQIPTFLVSKLAKESVTVSLSGDGGDELFGGYNRYFWYPKIWRHTSWLPLGLRKGLAKQMKRLSAQQWDHLNHVLAPLLPKSLRVRQAGDKVHKLSRLLAAGAPDQVYRILISHCLSPARIVLNSEEPDIQHGQPPEFLPNAAEGMMAQDLTTYLPDDILVKVDRASMAVSLEARVPFLDHRIVEYAWQLPLDLKIRGSQGKWLLRQLLYRYVPQELIERPKMGFGVPLDSWLKGPLREWAESLLTESRLREEGYFDAAVIRSKWANYLAGRAHNPEELWDVLMFQAWLEAHRHTHSVGCPY